MIHEIMNLHSKITTKEIVRIVLPEELEIEVGRDDLLKETPTDMLRIIRANGNIVTINPRFVVMVCTRERREF